MKIYLFIAFIASFFIYLAIPAQATQSDIDKPLLFRLRNQSSLKTIEMKKSFQIALYTLESSIGLLLSFFSAALAKDLLVKGQIGYLDPFAMPIFGALGIPLSTHGLIRLYKELNISKQIKTVSALLKKQLLKPKTESKP